jgi:uncharacterized surface protein with fasciclin (FAS1) repeats
MKSRLVAGSALSCLLVYATISSASEPKTIYDFIDNSSKFTILRSAIAESRLVAPLNTMEGKNTLFAPTDEAFKKLSPDQLKKLIDDKDLLKKIIQAHMVLDKSLTQKDLKGMKDLNGFPISTEDGIKIGNAKMTAFDTVCRNGVIHTIDTVLIPVK